VEKVKLGSTELVVTRSGFGALPIQRVDINEAVKILRTAFESGINFFDTARAYTDSEEKLGRALKDVRDKVIIATKSGATTRTGVINDLEASLSNLKTDYVDLLQLHNPIPLPDPNDPESAYAGLLEAQQKGMARFIGITSHRLDIAKAAVNSGLYKTMQYPLCYLSSKEDLELIGLCREANVGLIAMKPLCGGLLTNLRPAFTFFRQYDNVIPIWGIQRMSELEELLELEANPPTINAELEQIIEKDRAELSGQFCRCCGYCPPCPVEIPIPMAARMHLLLRRMPWQPFLSDHWYQAMHKVEECTACGKCTEKCPYNLDPPTLMKRALAEYKAFYQKHAPTLSAEERK
jgi:aryl-alcohol dehydrogenase-like predicted oxidoreductase